MNQSTQTLLFHNNSFSYWEENLNNPLQEENIKSKAANVLQSILHMNKQQFGSIMTNSNIVKKPNPSALTSLVH